MIQISNCRYYAKWSVGITFKRKVIGMISKNFTIVEDEQVLLERIENGIALIRYNGWYATLSESDFDSVFARVHDRISLT